MTDESAESLTPAKRPRGRPRKNPAIEREPVREPIKSTTPWMKSRPNWDEVEEAEDGVDRLRIPPNMIPDDMSLQWVTTSVFGQSVAQHRAGFEKRGWTPVHQSDFGGRFDGMFMRKGAEGEITVDSMVLMARPKQMTNRAEEADKRAAREQVMIKERALRGGDLPSVSLDSRHPSAINTNRINKTIERLDIPDK